MPASKPLPAVADLLPHTGVARLLTEVLDISTTIIRGTGRIPADHPLARQRTAPSLLAVEIGAQAAAAMEAIGRPGAPHAALEPRAGSLVRIRNAQFAQSSLPVETALEVTAELIGSAPPLAMYRIRVTLEASVVVEATISTYSGDPGQPA
jgi:predicted hotdog family 3-hydroxylacyl-ACP dehydratase